MFEEQAGGLVHVAPDDGGGDLETGHDPGERLPFVQIDPCEQVLLPGPRQRHREPIADQLGADGEGGLAQRAVCQGKGGAVEQHQSLWDSDLRGCRPICQGLLAVRDRPQRSVRGCDLHF